MLYLYANVAWDFWFIWRLAQHYLTTSARVIDAFSEYGHRRQDLKERVRERCVVKRCTPLPT